ARPGAPARPPHPTAVGAPAAGPAPPPRPAPAAGDARAAAAWQRRAVDVWQDWPRRAATSAFDRGRLAGARRDLDEYVRLAALAGPGGGR
ncbi:MAG: hypothetical protein ABW221_19940, partial [Vicinamibacteria bacterium]